MRCAPSPSRKSRNGRWRRSASSRAFNSAGRGAVQRVREVHRTNSRCVRCASQAVVLDGTADEVEHGVKSRVAVVEGGALRASESSGRQAGSPMEV